MRDCRPKILIFNKTPLRKNNEDFKLAEIDD